MTPALAGEQGRREDRDRDLDGEHDRADARGGPQLQRAHLAHDREPGRDAGGEGPRGRDDQGLGARRVGDELGRQPAPSERGAGRERRGSRAAAAPPTAGVGRQGERAEPAERDAEHGGASAVRRGLRGDDGEPCHPRDDRHDAGDLTPADGLVQGPRAEHQQQDEPARERGLDHAEGREPQGRHLQWPAEQPERRPDEPARPAHEERGEREAQPGLPGRAARVDGLQRDARVVEDGRRARERGPGDHGRHAHRR